MPATLVRLSLSSKIALYTIFCAALPLAQAQTPMNQGNSGTSMSSGKAQQAGSNKLPGNPEMDGITKEKPSPELIRKFKEAAVAMEKKDYPTALARIDESEKLAGANPSILSVLSNLRGAIYVKQKDWPKAEESFSKASQMDTKNFGPRYNLGEIMFMQKRYPEARERFQKLATEEPKNDLVRYKIFLTYLAENNLTEAKKIMGTFDSFSDLPSYYFAQAAWEYKNNNPKEGRSWVSSAQKIYPVFKNALFADALTEMGLVPQAPVTDKK